MCIGKLKLELSTPLAELAVGVELIYRLCTTVLTYVVKYGFRTNVKSIKF